jgi:hypothetical protein
VTAAEANECVSILEEQLTLTLKTQGDEIVARQAAKAEAEEAAEAAKKASRRLQDLADESQGKVGALQDIVQTLQVRPRKTSNAPFRAP